MNLFFYFAAFNSKSAVIIQPASAWAEFWDPLSPPVINRDPLISLLNKLSVIEFPGLIPPYTPGSAKISAEMQKNWQPQTAVKNMSCQKHKNNVPIYNHVISMILIQETVPAH